jgi:hypothetical protein
LFFFEKKEPKLFPVRVVTRRGRPLAAGLAAAVLLSACGVTDTYTPQPIPMVSPAKVPNGTMIPGTAIAIAAYVFNSPAAVHGIFGHNGLWRKHVLIVRLDIESNDKVPTDVLIDSAYVSINGTQYRAISAGEAYDIAWQAHQPYAAVAATFLGIGELLFTIVTLGLGDIVYALPSPFAQPKPGDDAFSRDLANQGLQGNIRLIIGSVRSGYLYFAMPQTMDFSTLKNAALVVHFLENTPTPTEQSITFTLPPVSPVTAREVRPVLYGLLGAV